MGKFDPIDIFFIAIISTYFITLICVGITFLCIFLSKRKKEKQVLLTQKVVIEKAVTPKEELSVSKSDEKQEKKLKERLVAVPLFRKLFMKEVVADKQSELPKVLETKK